MDELNKTAQTIVEEQPAKVEPIVEVGKVAEPQPDVEAEKLAAQEKQLKEKNAEQARRRREEERQQALDKRELEAAIKLTGGINPYTQEKIEDKADLEELYMMKEIEKNGGDPLADFAKYQKQKRKENKTIQTKQDMSEEQVRKDWQDFTVAHPDVSIKDLMVDEAFLDYADGKIGNKPLAKIYDGYKKFSSPKQPEKTPEKTVVKSTPGSIGGSSTPPPAEVYSKAEYEKIAADPQRLRKMNNEEFKKVMKSQEYWAKH